MKKFIKTSLVPLLTLVVLIFLGGGLYFLQKNFFSTKTAENILFDEENIILGQEKLKVKIADRPEKRRLGLMGFTELKSNEGMLFLFDRSAKLTFWNKNMNIPIDVVWLNNDLVVGIDFLPAEKEKGLVFIQSPTEVNQVLELPFQWTKNHQLKINERLIRK